MKKYVIAKGIRWHIMDREGFIRQQMAVKSIRKQQKVADDIKPQHQTASSEGIHLSILKYHFPKRKKYIYTHVFFYFL